MQSEIWKPVVGYEGLYEVSNTGKVRSLERITTVGRRGIGKELKQYLLPCGYLDVSLSNSGKIKHKRVHRLVADAFCENPDGKDEVNHIDGNKKNNSASNLEWVTAAENKRHCREVLGKINRNPNTEAANNACKKRVRCIDTGAEYESITYAAKAIGVAQSSLSTHLLGKKQNCKGFVFEYLGGN